jgi:outer membrane protein
MLSFIIALIGLSPSLEARTISINEVLEMASTSPEVKSAESMASAASSVESNNWRQIYMPKVSADIQYSRQLQQQGLELKSLPIPTIGFERDTLIGSVKIVQPIFDPENMLYSSSASKNIAEAEMLKASRQVKETQGKAISYYLQILELRSKRNALDKFASNLKNRQPEIRRLYQLGHVSESDVLKIKLGIDDANQGIRELKQKEEFLGELLANLLGQEGVFRPENLPTDLPQISSIAETIEPEKREDIRGLDKQLEALQESQSSAKASYLPKVAAFASHTYINTDVLMRKNSDAIGLLLSWSIFDGGSKSATSKEAAFKKVALEHTRYLAIGAIRASYIDAVKTLSLKRQEYEERKAAVIEAKKVTDLEFTRLKSGKTTINNLIDAEDVLKDRIEKASLTQTSWYQAWFSAQVASGNLISAP